MRCCAHTTAQYQLLKEQKTVPLLKYYETTHWKSAVFWQLVSQWIPLKMDFIELQMQAEEKQQAMISRK